MVLPHRAAKAYDKPQTCLEHPRAAVALHGAAAGHLPGRGLLLRRVGRSSLRHSARHRTDCQQRAALHGPRIYAPLQPSRRLLRRQSGVDCILAIRHAAVLAERNHRPVRPRVLRVVLGLYDDGCHRYRVARHAPPLHQLLARADAVDRRRRHRVLHHRHHPYDRRRRAKVVLGRDYRTETGETTSAHCHYGPLDWVYLPVPYHSLRRVLLLCGHERL